MENPDLEYICAAIGNLCGVPIRLYLGDELIFYRSVVRLPRDPMELCREGIWAVDARVGYYATENFSYYGVVRSGGLRIVLGPTRQIKNTDSELRELAFRLDVPAAERDAFVAGMKSIVPMPLDSIMQTLCTVNYILNGEKLVLTDIATYDAARAEFPDLLAEDADAPYTHNTLDTEKEVMDFVRRGDAENLIKWMSTAPAVRGGILAADQLRQMKNTFVVSTTLASRAAIEGGLDAEEALSASDAYIQKCELLRDVRQIKDLQHGMVLDFARRVERLRAGTNGSPLALKVKRYVLRHLSEPITAEAMADELYISRSYLSVRFRAETGLTLTDFVLSTKTEEAKRLLRLTDKPLASIASYLGFSSQSHFSRVFKKYAGVTPGSYRAAAR